MTHVVDQFETRLERQPPVVIRRWWIFAFVVSFLVFLSTLFFLGQDAHAISGGGGGNPAGGLTSGGDGVGDSAKGGGQQQPALGGGDSTAKNGDSPIGGDGPINNIASGNGNPS